MWGLPCAWTESAEAEVDYHRARRTKPRSPTPFPTKCRLASEMKSTSITVLDHARTRTKAYALSAAIPAAKRERWTTSYRVSSYAGDTSTRSS